MGISTSIKRVRAHVNPFVFHGEVPSFSPPSGPLDIEIGFAKGDFLCHWAQLFPRRFVLGIEVRKAMVSLVEERVSAMGLDNVGLVYFRAESFLEASVGLSSVDSFFIFHPDPWFKRRHAKRRLVRVPFAVSMACMLRGGGKVYISSDVDWLWEEMVAVMTGVGFSLVADETFWRDCYMGGWGDFSDRAGRSVYRGCFRWEVSLIGAGKAL